MLDKSNNKIVLIWTYGKLAQYGWKIVDKYFGWGRITYKGLKYHIHSQIPYRGPNIVEKKKHNYDANYIIIWFL
jgi:hypothetical protein